MDEVLDDADAVTATPAPTCVGLSAALGEPLQGSAGQATAWLLVEQPGPWGRFAFRESHLDADVGQALERACSESGVSPLLIKRHGRASRNESRTAYLVSSQPDAPRIARLTFRDPAELLELDFDALGDGRMLPGEPVDHPLYLVCTNGRRDPCCARLGRPIATRLAEARPEATWECSHTGGHRFAGVLLCLPHGIYYGRLDPDAALAAVLAYERGEIVTGSFRGRTAYAPAVQAADAYLRSYEQIAGLSELTLEEAADDVAVFTRADGTRYRVAVRAEEDEPPRAASCRDIGQTEKRPLVWRLEELERTARARGAVSDQPATRP